MAPRRTVLPSLLRRAISPNCRALRAIATRKRMTTLRWVLPKHLKRRGLGRRSGQEAPARQARRQTQSPRRGRSRDRDECCRVRRNRRRRRFRRRAGFQRTGPCGSRSKTLRLLHRQTTTSQPKSRRRSAHRGRRRPLTEILAETVAEIAAAAAVEDSAPAEVPAAVAPAAEEEASASARPTRRKPVAIDVPVVPVVSSTVADEAKAEEKPKRAGWWQRKGFF